MKTLETSLPHGFRVVTRSVNDFAAAHVAETVILDQHGEEVYGFNHGCRQAAENMHKPISDLFFMSVARDGEKQFQ